MASGNPAAELGNGNSSVTANRDARSSIWCTAAILGLTFLPWFQVPFHYSQWREITLWEIHLWIAVSAQNGPAMVAHPYAFSLVYLIPILATIALLRRDRTSQLSCALTTILLLFVTLLLSVLEYTLLVLRPAALLCLAAASALFLSSMTSPRIRLDSSKEEGKTS